MKKILLLLFLCTGFCQAQIVNIPDPVFKAFLINQSIDSQNILGQDNFPMILDANGDGEIQFTEAALVGSIHMEYVGVNDLTGIQSFINLVQLDCNNNNLVSLDISGLSFLYNLSASDNTLTSINLNGTTSLTSINLSFNQFTDLSLDNLPSLNNFQIGNNYGLNSLSLTNMPLLFNLAVVACELNTIHLSGLPVLNTIMCGDNNLTSIDISELTALENLACYNNMLTTIIGAEFTPLKLLDCANNMLTTLDLSNYSQLEYLVCGYNMLTTLDLSALEELTALNCHHNLLSSLNLTPVPNLNILDCTGNLFTALDFSVVPLLQELSVGNPQLTNLDISMLTDLRKLLAINLTQSSIDFEPLSLLGTVNISASALTSIDLSNSQVPNLWLVALDNPNLEFINMKNGQPSVDLGFVNCPQLRYVCMNDNYESYMCSPCSDPNIQVNSYCSFNPEGNHNTIQGTMRLDANQDGCDSEDIAMPFSKIKIDDGTNVGYAFTEDDSAFTFYTEAGTYVLTPQLEHPDYFIITPPTATVNFATANSTISTQDFCVTPNGVHADADVAIVPIMTARPGFDTHYQIIYTNQGNQIIDGTLTLTYDDAIIDFVESNPAIDNQLVNTLTWNYTNLLPFETRVIEYVLNLNGPMETPPLNQDDVLYFNAVMAYQIPDVNVFNTDCSLSQVVVNSYDPNDKSCLEGNIISPEIIGNYVHYNINFENIGTAEAINIVVKDVIDASKFDISTLQVIYASHPVMTRINGDVVEFIFENINLPGTTNNHGNVMFKIKTKPNLVIGNTISNKADIYFDYNFPIETNTATSTFNILQNNKFAVDATISVFPNPATEKISVKADSNIKSLQLYDLQGRILQSSIENSKETSVDISGKSNGVYFLKITAENGSKIEKLIKE